MSEPRALATIIEDAGTFDAPCGECSAAYTIHIEGVLREAHADGVLTGAERMRERAARLLKAAAKANDNGARSSALTQAADLVGSLPLDDGEGG